VPNGPAIKGGCVTRRQHRAGSWYPAVAGPENCHGARRVWRAFCYPGTSFIACRRGRGTSLINGLGIVPVDKAQKMQWRSVAMHFVSKAEISQGEEF